MAPGAGELPPLHAISADDRGSIVIISAYSWASITAVAAGARFVLSRIRKLGLGSDDLSFAVAAVLAVASTICFHLAANNGLGRHFSYLTPDAQTRYFKAVYAAQLVGISAMACAKLSVVLLTSRVVVQTPRSLYIALSVVAAWAVFSLISTAFQCQLPTPWEFIPSTCSSHGYVQYPVIATNILTDVALTGWVLPTFWKLNATKEMRVTAMVLFGLRIIVPLVAIVQLWATPKLLRSSDQSWAYFPRALLDQDPERPQEFGTFGILGTGSALLQGFDLLRVRLTKNILLMVPNRLAVINLSVILATIPRINRALPGMQDHIGATHISNFELNNNRPKEYSRRREPPPVTPPAESTTTTSTLDGKSEKKGHLTWALRFVPSFIIHRASGVTAHSGSGRARTMSTETKNGGADSRS